MPPEVSAKRVMKAKSPVGSAGGDSTLQRGGANTGGAPCELLLLAQCKLGWRPTRKNRISSFQEKQGHEDVKGLSKHLAVSPLCLPSQLSLSL